jgi:hypothetical protein
VRSCSGPDVRRAGEGKRATKGPGGGAKIAGAKVNVQVEIYGTVRDLIKKSKLEVDLSDRASGTYRDVLEALVGQYGPALRARIFGPENDLLSHVKIFSGGTPVKDLDGPIAPADGVANVKIIVFAAAGGG